MSIHHHTLRFLACASLFLLAACGDDVKQSLGLGKEAPDEFVVLSRPPLTLPPDFELRPPSSGSDKPAVPTTEAQARKTLLGTDTPTDDFSLRAPNVDTAVTPVTVSNAPTGATANFLSKAGADQANPDIRQTLGGDAKSPEAYDDAPTLYDRMVGKQKSDSIVDPQKETERLRDNQDAGKPVTEGDTPTVTPKEKSVLDRIF